jgi:hypothetical protein
MVSTVRFLFRNGYLSKYVILTNFDHETKYVYESPFNYVISSMALLLIGIISMVAARDEMSK